jgi:hypothetical protein
VDVVIDGVLLPTFYGVDRSDVAERWHDTTVRESGFLLKVPSSRLKAGPHVLSTRVLSFDRRCVFRGPDLGIVVR